MSDNKTLETPFGESKALDALVTDCVMRQGKKSVYRMNFISTAEAERAIRRAWTLAISTEVEALEDLAVKLMASMEDEILRAIHTAQSWIRPKEKTRDDDK